jgi:hypothetical protein
VSSSMMISNAANPSRVFFDPVKATYFDQYPGFKTLEEVQKFEMVLRSPDIEHDRFDEVLSLGSQMHIYWAQENHKVVGTISNEDYYRLGLQNLSRISEATFKDTLQPYLHDFFHVGARMILDFGRGVNYNERYAATNPIIEFRRKE